VVLAVAGIKVLLEVLVPQVREIMAEMEVPALVVVAAAPAPQDLMVPPVVPVVMAGMVQLMT
jgi:hypothetical protein